MSFNPSIGDLVLCTQIAYRVFSAVRDCKTTAPRDLKELEGVLRGLHIALEHLSSNISAIVNVVLSETIKDALQSMTSLCRQTLEELQDATRPYCNAAYDPVFPNGTAFTRKLPVRIKMHWKRFVWQMRGDSFTQYRNNLLLHTQSINVLVNTLNLFMAVRLDEEQVHQRLILEQMYRHIAEINFSMSQQDRRDVHAIHRGQQQVRWSVQ